MGTATHEPMTCDTGALNALLQGELSAVETYARAVQKFNDPSVTADLQTIRDEHQRAARALRDRVTAFGGTPADSAGPWGAFTAAVTASGKALAPVTVLAALRQGEEHGCSEYEEALRNEGIHPDCRALIRTDLLPACARHVEALNRLLGGDHS